MTESLTKRSSTPAAVLLTRMLPASAALQGRGDWSGAGHLQPAAPTRKGTALTYGGLASLQQQPRQQVRAGVTCKKTVGLASMCGREAPQSLALMTTHAQT